MTPAEIPPPDVLRDRIREAVARTPATGLKPPTRAVLAIVFILVAVALGVALMRPDIGTLPTASLIGVSLGIAFLAAATLVVALSPGSHGLGAPVTWLVALAATTAPLYALMTMMAGLGAAPDGPRVRGCFTMSLVVAIVGLAGLTFALRRAVPAAPVARGALLGACAGAWSGLTIHLHCPCGDAWHILLGHAVPIAICAALGALISPRFLRP
jgi:hypothetical protein